MRIQYVSRLLGSKEHVERYRWPKKMNDIFVAREKATLGIVSLILNKQLPHHRPGFVSAAVSRLLGFFPCLGNDEASPKVLCLGNDEVRPKVLRLGNDEASQCGAPHQTGMKLNRLLKFMVRAVIFVVQFRR